MASTLTAQSFVNLCSTHADLLPLAGVGGYTNEPALSLCNDALSEIINDVQDWKWNSVEMSSPQSLTLGTALPLMTMMNKQDYLFAGASAFVLQVAGNNNQSSGAPIDLASNSAITVTAGTVTVNTLEAHRFVVGQTVYIMGVVMTTGTASKYNSTFTDNGNQTTWSNGWVITAVTNTSFSFAATAGQNNSDVGGAAGITDFSWLSAASMMELNNNSSPVNVRHIKAVRNLTPLSRINDPTEVAVIQDLGTGVLRIRFSFAPGSVIWIVNFTYQKKAPLLTSLSQTIAPVPDQYSAMYRQALLYRMYRYINSPNQAAEFQKMQAEIQKAKGADTAEESNVYMEPDNPLVDLGYWVGY